MPIICYIESFLEMNCCENFTFQHETKRCANIHIPLDETADDKVFKTNHKACMKFTRSDRAKAVNEIDIDSFHINFWKSSINFREISLTTLVRACPDDGTVENSVDNVRHQFNALTSFLDLSAIYSQASLWSTNNG